MTLQEIWKIKEELSEAFWGKSADEINKMIESDVNEVKHRIEEL